MFKTIIFVALFATQAVFAQSPETTKSVQQETKIPFMDIFWKMPETSWNGIKMSFTKESIPWWVGITGSTLILVHNDEKILNDIQADGRNMGIGNEDNTRPIIYFGDIDIIRLPTDTGSFLYFLGDGWMHGGIAAGFALTGHLTDDNRAYNTGLRIMHGMMVSTIFNQFTKRAFGRESPYHRTEPGGKWRPFPSISAYQTHTPDYDAMPSGHVMTATMTFTVINEAYPEYTHFLVPIEILWVTALSWQMVNNGVHWASDYPLGIAMGYVFGKAASQLGKTHTNPITKTEWNINPYTTGADTGLAWTYRY